MRMHYAGVAGLALLCGCLSAPKSTWPMAKRAPDEDVAVYGLHVIRLGMSEQAVDECDRSSKSFCYCGGGALNPYDVTYGSGLTVTYDAGKVIKCRAGRLTISGVRGTATDADLAAVLKPGMAPYDVEMRVGVPKCGYESEPGTVALLFPQPGIQVVFTDGKLSSWSRTHTYIPDKPADIHRTGGSR